MRATFRHLIIGAAALLPIVSFQSVHAQGTAAQTRMVNVAGNAMRLRSAGLDRRAANTPIIVLEAGAGGAIESWSPVFAQIASIAPVVAYDRRGLGQLAVDGKRPTPQHVAETLHGLLETAGIAPPTFWLATPGATRSRACLPDCIRATAPVTESRPTCPSSPFKRFSSCLAKHDLSNKP